MPKSVQLFIEIGHIAMCRDKNRIEPGKTHDWLLFVRGKNDEQGFINLVEKVVFQLHDSFDEPTRIIESPPFELRESGYGIFTAHLEVHFQWHEKTSHLFSHDITLPIEGGPSIEMTKTEKLKFEGIPDDLVDKILKCGGTLISDVKSSKSHKHHHDSQKSFKRKSSPNEINNLNKKSLDKKYLETTLFGDSNDDSIHAKKPKEKHKHHRKDSIKESSRRHSLSKDLARITSKEPKKYEERGNSPSTPNFLSIPQIPPLSASLQPPLLGSIDQSTKPRAIVGPFNDAPDSSNSSSPILNPQPSVNVRFNLGVVAAKPNLNALMDHLRDSDDDVVDEVKDKKTKKKKVPTATLS